jgi:hypothetical protein
MFTILKKIKGTESVLHVVRTRDVSANSRAADHVIAARDFYSQLTNSAPRAIKT